MRYAIAVALAGLAAWLIWIGGKQAGLDQCAAEHKVQADKAAEKIEQRDTSAATVNASTTSFLWGALPPIEIKAYESRERVRTIYRDRPVAGQCVRPSGVQEELNAARDRANAAIGAVRTGADAGSPAAPAAGRDGRLGAAGDGHTGSRGNEGISSAEVRAGPS